MRNPRLLLVLCSLAFALAVVLMRPLPSRADPGETTPVTPDPNPVSTDPVAHQLPVVKAVRRPAAVVHKVLHVPLGEKVVKYAKHFLGVRYVYGGSTPSSGFDCSGFVRYVYGHFGIRLAHSSFAQFTSGFRVGRGGLKPGDLVFFNGLGHVGIYVGNGKFIHAPHSGTRVRIESLGGWYSRDLDGARRLAGAR
ncbi:MAG: peptidoglycan DL-endopeptidase CwlO [Gaiellaceae bacterium]|jgi:cell wall-associated NlpC family hydrolase|nr:peptidoglycan DL-endopeptidase CwlO [Gaiellaceae bacterium]MDX6473050.1 peptidoglycan DL-endopeptidase CwlO [Gaiellaceae bacterium]